MNFIQWGVKLRKNQIIWWSFGIIIFVGLNLAFYPSFKDQTAQLEQSMQQVPEAARAFISDTGEFMSPVGYLSSQVFYLMLPMLLSILGISLGSSLIGREEKEKTIELLLSRPISRSNLLFSKAFSGFTTLSIVWVIATLSILVICKLVDMPVPLDNIFFASAHALLFATSVSAIAFMLAATKWTKANSSVIASVIALAGFILTSLVATAAWLKWPAMLFPFYYYRPGEVLNGSMTWNGVLVPLSVTAIALLLSWLSFRKRDLN